MLDMGWYNCINTMALLLKCVRTCILSKTGGFVYTQGSERKKKKNTFIFILYNSFSVMMVIFHFISLALCGKIPDTSITIFARTYSTSYDICL